MTREQALAQCLREAQTKSDGLRREVQHLTDVNLNLRVELAAADAIVAQALDALLGAGLGFPKKGGGA